MSWERDPLWAKARLFFGRAFDEPRDDPRFGLWCSLGLELLARAALASISPTLLAAPENTHRYLLHALGRALLTEIPGRLRQRKCSPCANSFLVPASQTTT